MAPLRDEFFDEDAIITEGRFGLVLGRPKTFARLGFIPCDAHALATAPGGSLYHHGIADGRRYPDSIVGIFDQLHMPGHSRNAGLGGDLLGGDLIAHRLNGAGRRSDEGNAFLLQGLGESRVLGQESVARMHRIRARPADCVEDFRYREIGLARRCRPDRDGLICHLHMQRVTIGIRIDGDGRDSELSRRLDDATGDLSAVGDQELLKHLSHKGMVSCFFQRGSTCLPRSAAKALTIRLREECGMITSSMKPRSAAMKGLAKRAS